MALIVLLNNFFHDFSAAGWLFSSVLLWVLFKDKNIQPDKNLIRITRTLLLLMNISLFGIVAFGVVRTLAYKTYEWNHAAGQAQVTLLIVKHVIFTVIFVYGLLYYLKAKSFIKKATNENQQ